MIHRNGYYWIVMLDEQEGPEITRLRCGLFFTTRTNGDGEVVAASDNPDYVQVISGPLTEPVI